ncbi:aminotransferase class I/II-fold pyridoxal phosphate-dependent enzyme [Evansella cellulosilytica]|uniref:Orn/Lys/Arg decarboxylase major region n=1 Tax=Evansella cellulosilytica (strain ATCC 21833 / DSM 2522 / FERM P-1141 / JCM 9156 / N-4) TaxID=649639 RepID=E6TRM7_EVAC2|nr:aminotransferase class V-fold PLP-dependent enzyme [Evansella cellulosilytica]ADU28321.1 Orn/Lys/Arg decarboxylase major region [Evansella cellulosilytica DSM 2522]
MNQNRTPLFDKVIRHAKKKPTSFHVPGHKNGLFFYEKAVSTYKSILEIDLTEITNLDDLHHPTGVIKEAQQLTSALYGVKNSFFLVGGTTVGNIAMIMSSVSEGDTILVQRNSHQSVFHAIELAKARPVYLEPEVDNETGLALGISEKVVEEAVTKYSDAKMLVLTSPTYEGYAQCLKKHVEHAHKKNMIVGVDEAHGAHFIIGDSNWPTSSIAAGADIIVHSAHKMLPAMTMSSFVHVNSKLVDVNKFKYYLKIFQSSSPSYPLMASLDVARAYLANIIHEGTNALLKQISTLREKLGEGPTWMLSPSLIGHYRQDPLKVAFISKNKVASSWQGELEKLDIYPELVSPNHLLLVLPLASGALPIGDWAKKIVKGLKEVGKSDPISPIVMNEYDQSSSPALSIHEVDKYQKERVELEAAVGKISAETITPYPPGVPFIMKGEVITKNHVLKLMQLKDNNSYFQTGNDWKGLGILIVRKEKENGM